MGILSLSLKIRNALEIFKLRLWNYDPSKFIYLPTVNIN